MAKCEIVLGEAGKVDNYVTTGLTVYASRCTIDNGGYYVKDGVCYVDMTITVTTNLSSNYVIQGFPLPKPSAANNYYYLSSDPFVANTNFFILKPSAVNTVINVVSATIGSTYRLIGKYFTDAADT